MAINVYWCRSMPGVDELVKQGFGEDSFISPLRVQAPVPLIKHLDYKEFFGPNVSRCPAVVDELKNIFVIKSPVTLGVEVKRDRLNVAGQSIPFAQSFLGNPQGRFGIMQMSLGYLFFAEKSLLATQLPPYYDHNGYTEKTFSISASYDIGRWFRPVCKPSFIFKPKIETIEIKEGDALAYIKFNTQEKINLIEFDDPRINLLNEQNPAIICAMLKKQSEGILSLAKCYEYFEQYKMRRRILKLIKQSKLK